MSRDIKAGWLNDYLKGYFAPKTLMSQVLDDESGITLHKYFENNIFETEIRFDLSHNESHKFGLLGKDSISDTNPSVWPGVEGILRITNGGTGNQYGYIRTGSSSTDIGDYATIEGYSNTGSGQYAHAEGANNVASGQSAHAQGLFTMAEGMGSHSGGFLSEATGQYAFAHGSSTIASGILSFAIGNGSQAKGENAFAAGNGTVAQGNNSFVIGKYNITDVNNQFAFIVGNGNGSGSSNSNAFTIDWNGNAVISNQLSVNGDATIANNLAVSDKLTVDDTATFGVNVRFNQYIATDIIPNGDGLLNLGGEGGVWNDLQIYQIDFHNAEDGSNGGSVYCRSNALSVIKGNSSVSLDGTDATLAAGNLNLNCDALVLSSSNYGYTLPNTGVEGQVFFLLLEE